MPTARLHELVHNM